MNRESASEELKKQELEIKTMVLETRTKMNGHLDKVQEKLLHELKSTSQTCKSKYIKILQKLKSTEEMLTKLKKQTLHIKQFSSDIQVFLCTRQVHKQIKSEIESIMSEIGATKDFKLKVTMHRLIENMLNFGNIKVSECTAKLDFSDPKIDQAQSEINIKTSRNISDIQLQLIQSFQIKWKSGIDILSCVLLPNGHLLMENYAKENP